MSLEERVKKLENEINVIKSRNKRVEANKAWETSLFRILIISGMTYLASAIVFTVVKIPSPLQNALIPTIAFFISMQSLPFIKKMWMESRKR
jgi:hypothetical protein